MSQAPAQEEDASQALLASSPYRRQLAELNQRLHRGGSLSGRERNCAFLNLGESGRFATISAISGMDFADDGRALALSDWDGDGDLDLWMANRTGPRVRYLRNEAGGKGNHFLALKLQGTAGNRDAIGARVEVRLPDARPVSKSLRAGEGYLGQSSKWLHLGLGKATKIEEVRVRWPGGATETFNGLKVDAFYQLLEGESTAREVKRDGRASALTPGNAGQEETPGSPAIRLTSPVPLPPLTCRDFAGNAASVFTAGEETKPVLLTLWASWCPPCVRELAAFSEASGADGTLSDVRVVALAVNGLGPGGEGDVPGSTMNEARAVWDKLAPPFFGGQADAETIRRLQFIHDYLFGQERPLTVPMSFLIDTQGRLAALYRAPVRLEDLGEDVRIMQMNDGERVVAALPFAGRWIDGRKTFAPVIIPGDLAAHGHLQESLEYVSRHWQELSGQREFPSLALQLAHALTGQKAYEPALNLLRATLRVHPRHVPAMNHLSYHLLRQGPLAAGAEQARVAEAVQWAERAAEATGHRLPAVLDTLAAAYAARKDFEKAADTASHALRLTTEPADRKRRETTWKSYQEQAQE